jgi:endonuclease YncB( thermonuclease family)
MLLRAGVGAMASFTVTAVVDGDTFDVTPGWTWNGNSGSRVRPTGYDAPELDQPGGQAARRKLDALIRGKRVELGSAYRVDRGRLVCDVLLNGKKLADYFPEYQ